MSMSFKVENNTADLADQQREKLAAKLSGGDHATLRQCEAALALGTMSSAEILDAAETAKAQGNAASAYLLANLVGSAESPSLLAEKIKAQGIQLSIAVEAAATELYTAHRLAIDHYLDRSFVTSMPRYAGKIVLPNDAELNMELVDGLEVAAKLFHSIAEDESQTRDVRQQAIDSAAVYYAQLGDCSAWTRGGIPQSLVDLTVDHGFKQPYLMQM